MARRKFPWFLFVAFTLIVTCKKSNLNPHCGGELTNARIYNVGCDYGMVRFELEDGNHDYQSWDGDINLRKIPKKLTPAEGDSMDVKIKYTTQKQDLCLMDASPCTPCIVIKIKCIQKR